MPETIGVISDTHGLLRPEAIAALEGCDRIIHAGDVGSADVLNQLRRIAPVVAVRGNVDKGRWSIALPYSAVVELDGHSIHVIHILADLDLQAIPGRHQRGSVRALSSAVDRGSEWCALPESRQRRPAAVQISGHRGADVCR